MGRCLPERQDFLLQFIRDRRDLTTATVDPSLPEPFAQADPYLLASALQKAIRRGDAIVARRAGYQLYAIDRQRLWRRLAVIALEDVGIADINVATELIAIATMTAARRLLGGDTAALDFALARACAAAKDRTGDHLCSIIGRERAPSQEQAALKMASLNALLAIVASADLPWTYRLHAAVIASGRSEIVHSGARIAAVLDVLHEHGVPPLLLTSCEAYAARQRDALPVFVPFAWMLRAPGCTDCIIARDLTAPDMVGDWPCYVFDPVNTRLGRQAVDLWLKSYLVKPPWLPRQVAAALWNAESALCDRTLSWPLGDTIQKRAYAADLTFRGLPVERHPELNAWIAREMPALNAARLAVWNSVVRQSGKPAETLEQATLPLPVPEGQSRRG